MSPLAGWQSGHAAACKAVYAGSIPTPASKLKRYFVALFFFPFSVFIGMPPSGPRAQRIGLLLFSPRIAAWSRVFWCT